MAFSWDNLTYPVILCPPMDGITDNSFRELISRFGGSGALYTEFVNVKGLIYQNPKSFFELRYTENQRPIIVQLFGNTPEDFYEASQIVVNMGFDAIDINMGCPSRNVFSKGGGCALMGDTNRAKEIVKATIEGANIAAKKLKLNHEIEVTCKMRLGINEKYTVLEHGMAMIEAGAKAIAIHGRTLKQMYSGFADWNVIKQFVAIKNKKYGESIKVFASGDVKSLFEAYIRILIYGVDGVMIGRGCLGKPWIFDKRRVSLLLDYIKSTEKKLGKKSGEISLAEIESLENFMEIKNNLENPVLDLSEIADIAIYHAVLMYKDKGVSGIVQMRKHLAWYFQGFDGAKDLRNKLVRVESLDEIRSILAVFQK